MTLGQTIKVLLADDHVLIRQGMRRILEFEPDIEVVGEAGDGQQAIELIDSLSPDIILMDLRMPVMNGIDAVHLLKRKGLSHKVIALSFYEAMLGMAIDAGLGGYLLKDFHRGELVKAIRLVFGGEVALSHGLWSNPDEGPNILKRLRERFGNKPVQSPNEASGIVIITQPPAESGGLLRFLSRLARLPDAEILEMTPTPHAEILLRVSVLNEEEFRNHISTWPEVRYAWEDSVAERTGQRTQSYLRVLLEES